MLPKPARLVFRRKPVPFYLIRPNSLLRRESPGRESARQGIAKGKISAPAKIVGHWRRLG